MIKRRQIPDMIYPTTERKLDNALDLSEEVARIIQEQLFDAMKDSGLESLIHSFWGIYFLGENEEA